MKLAPIGIGALSAGAAAQFGSEMFGPLSLLVVGIWIAQLIFAASILLLLALILRQSPLPFLRATGPSYATAAAPRSEERRVGKECVNTRRSRWSQYH